MKALFLVLFFSLSLLFSFGQKDDLSFYVKNGAKNIKEMKCSDLGELWVTVPIPANVGDYDGFSVTIYLSTINYNLLCFFDKDKIKSKLVGKKSIDLFVLGPEGTAKTDFGDKTVYNDLCNTPRVKGIKNFEVVVTSYTQMIKEVQTITEWSEGQNAYITRQKPIWKEGEPVSKSKFTVIQTDMEEGVKDSKGNFIIKIPNLAQSEFQNFESNSSHVYSQITITDKSMGKNVKIKIVELNTQNLSFEQIIKDFEEWMNEKKVNPDIYYRGIISDNLKQNRRAKFNGVKDKTFSDFTIGSLTGKTITWYQSRQFVSDPGAQGSYLVPALYSKIYIFKNGEKAFLGFVYLEDIISSEGKKAAFGFKMKPEWFTVQFTDEEAINADKILVKVLESLKFLK